MKALLQKFTTRLEIILKLFARYSDWMGTAGAFLIFFRNVQCMLFFSSSFYSLKEDQSKNGFPAIPGIQQRIFSVTFFLFLSLSLPQFSLRHNTTFDELHRRIFLSSLLWAVGCTEFSLAILAFCPVLFPGASAWRSLILYVCPSIYLG